MSSRADERIKRSVLFAFVAVNTLHPRTSKVNCLISRDFQLLCKGYLLGT